MKTPNKTRGAVKKYKQSMEIKETYKMLRNILSTQSRLMSC